MSARTVWLITKAARPAAAPSYLAEGEEERLFWTTDRAKALHFAERHLANRFSLNRVTEPVCVIDQVEG